MINRRDFIRLAAVGGGAVFVSGLGACAAPSPGGAGSAGASDDFYFVQLSDTHWGFSGTPNPDAANTLKRAVETVNTLEVQPAFIVFTGDLTHTTDDPEERRKRMAEFRDIVAGLKVRQHYYMPGEHDASLDRGAAFREYFGETRYSFDRGGVHFVVIDNVSDPGASIGEEQLAWLEADLDKVASTARIVVFTHRPLFDLVPKWDWATRDGARAIAILSRHADVTVFYGHIHQEHHFMTGHIAHHAAKSLIFPLPAPGSQDKRTPLPWDAAAPHRGLGFREVALKPGAPAPAISEFPVTRS